MMVDSSQRLCDCWMEVEGKERAPESFDRSPSATRTGRSLLHLLSCTKTRMSNTHTHASSSSNTFQNFFQNHADFAKLTTSQNSVISRLRESNSRCQAKMMDISRRGCNLASLPLETCVPRFLCHVAGKQSSEMYRVQRGVNAASNDP